MTYVLHLQHKQVGKHGGEYWPECGDLCRHLHMGLTGLLEESLDLDLAPLKQIMTALGDTDELIEAYGYTKVEALRIQLHQRKQLDTAWQAPAVFMNALSAILTAVGYPDQPFPPSALARLQHSDFAGHHNGEEMYFGTGYFIADLVTLRVVIERARILGVPQVRMVVERW